MQIMSVLNTTVSIRQVQRNYKDVVSLVEKAKKPVVVMNRSQAQLAIINLQQLEEYERLKSFAVLDKIRTKNRHANASTAYSDITSELELVREAGNAKV